MDGADEIDKALLELMAMVKPSQRRKSIRAALSFLRKQNMTRIKAQQNPDGSPYAPRRKSKLIGKTSVWIKGREDDAYTGDIERKRGKNYVTMTFPGGFVRRFKKDDVIKTRKVKAKNKKMLTGFAKAKMMMVRMFGTDKGVVNFSSGARPVALKHHFGNAELSLPARQLLGLPEADKQQALRIMLASLTTSVLT